jgi:hypothetical protein
MESVVLIIAKMGGSVEGKCLNPFMESVVLIITHSTNTGTEG